MSSDDCRLPLDIYWEHWTRDPKVEAIWEGMKFHMSELADKEVKPSFAALYRVPEANGDGLLVRVFRFEDLIQNLFQQWRDIIYRRLPPEKGPKTMKEYLELGGSAIHHMCLWGRELQTAGMQLQAIYQELTTFLLAERARYVDGHELYVELCDPPASASKSGGSPNKHTEEMEVTSAVMEDTEVALSVTEEKTAEFPHGTPLLHATADVCDECGMFAENFYELPTLINEFCENVRYLMNPESEEFYGDDWNRQVELRLDTLRSWYTLLPKISARFRRQEKMLKKRLAEKVENPH